MRPWVFLCILASLSLSGVFAAAVHAENADEADPNRHAIRAASREYVAAKRRGDIDTLRKMWTSDGDYIDSLGRAFKAQQLLQGQSPPSTPNAKSSELPSQRSMLRFITPDVAIEDGGAAQGRFTAVWVKRDGHWLLDSLRETSSAAPRFNEKLKPLAWLLGEFVGLTDDAAILLSSHWSNDGNYIVREFLFRRDGREDISATQRIGWDSSAEKIRCWTFDSQGGASEGTWSRQGMSWLVESADVLADGKKSKSSVVLTPGGDGSFVSEVKSDWAADAATAGGKLATLRVEFRRAPEDAL
jgi:hypothetical protein